MDHFSIRGIPHYYNSNLSYRWVYCRKNINRRKQMEGDSANIFPRSKANWENRHNANDSIIGFRRELVDSSINSISEVKKEQMLENFFDFTEFVPISRDIEVARQLVHKTVISTSYK